MVGMIKKDQEFDDLLKFYQDYACRHGWIINPDKMLVAKMIDQILKYKRKYGELYCPCSVVRESNELRENKVCPCPSHKKQIEEEGHCSCQLFLRRNMKKKFKVDKSRCTGCGLCVDICPFGAIKIDNQGKAEIDIDRCKGCGKCQRKCPLKAIKEVPD